MSGNRGAQRGHACGLSHRPVSPDHRVRMLSTYTGRLPQVDTPAVYVDGHACTEPNCSIDSTLSQSLQRCIFFWHRTAGCSDVNGLCGGRIHRYKAAHVSACLPPSCVINHRGSWSCCASVPELFPVAVSNRHLKHTFSISKIQMEHQDFNIQMKT
jgi:hypothetical protein